MRSIAIPALAVLLLSLAGPAAGEYPWPKPQSFEVELSPVDDSEVSGIAHLVLRGDRLTVLVRAFGLDPTQVHPLIIHGFPGGRAATCPDAAPAVQETSSLTADDVRAVFGFGLIGLDPSPEADRGGAVAFEHSYAIDASAVAPLSRRTLVLYHSSGIPIACGEIRGYLTG
jgi:hypothetical protein